MCEYVDSSTSQARAQEERATAERFQLDVEKKGGRCGAQVGCCVHSEEGLEYVDEIFGDVGSRAEQSCDQPWDVEALDQVLHVKRHLRELRLRLRKQKALESSGRRRWESSGRRRWRAAAEGVGEPPAFSLTDSLVASGARKARLSILHSTSAVTRYSSL